jgi:hypothetical protein
VNTLVFEVQSCLSGEFFVKLHFKNKHDSFRWVLMAVYGAAQPEDKDRFLAEWVNACSEESLPLMVGGDFNIIRNPSEKSKDRFNGRWPAFFNGCIKSLNLRVQVLSGCKFMRANSATVPTFKKTR